MLSLCNHLAKLLQKDSIKKTEASQCMLSFCNHLAKLLQKDSIKKTEASQCMLSLFVIILQNCYKKIASRKPTCKIVTKR
jgi:dsDNA-binding SOS-regulon protein